LGALRKAGGLLFLCRLGQLGIRTGRPPYDDRVSWWWFIRMYVKVLRPDMLRRHDSSPI